METIRFDKEDVEVVAELLIEGAVVAFPTDTVYGLGVIYDDEQALQQLKEAKQRPDTKPIPTMVGTMEQMEQIAYVTPNARKLANAFMPGAITLILKKKEVVKEYVTNGLDTIGIRMPDDAFLIDLITRCGKPLLVTSANISGDETGVMDQQVLDQLDGAIDAIVLGEAEGKQASTIVDVTSEDIKILRKGPIQESEIFEVIHA